MTTPELVQWFYSLRRERQQLEARLERLKEEERHVHSLLGPALTLGHGSLVVPDHLRDNRRRCLLLRECGGYTRSRYDLRRALQEDPALLLWLAPYSVTQTYRPYIHMVPRKKGYEKEPIIPGNWQPGRRAPK